MHDAHFAIESNRSDMAARLGKLLGDLRAPAVAPDATPVVYTVDWHGPPWSSHPWGVWRNGEPRATTLVPSAVVEYLLWEITRLLLEHASPDIPAYAGAVARNGKALMLAGRRRTGKSTLTAWLTTRGWGFLTDEVAILGLSGERAVVLPFWRPVGVRRGGPLEHVVADSDIDDPALVPASTLGALASATPLAAVVLPMYSPGHSHDLAPLTPAETLVGLTEHLPLLRQQGRQSFAAMVRVADTVPGYSLAVDDLHKAEQQLSDLMGSLP